MNVALRRSGRSICRAFSLVEIVLALGILSFALVAILGMVPVGLTSLRESIDATAQAHMVQTLLNDANSTSDWSTLVASTRYFDESGQSLESQNSLWSYRVRMALVPVELEAGGVTAQLPGQTLLVGIEMRSHPVPNPNWVMGSAGQFPEELSVHSVVLMK